VKVEGEMWRKQGVCEAFVIVRFGTCITIPVSTQFQFRSFGNTSLTAAVIKMPPWPGDSEPMFSSGV
jgi:mannose-6-phosphate isomerase-like protein (cupin superfamily)